MKAVFDAAQDARLRALGKRQQVRMAVLVALWSAALIGVWLWYIISSGRSLIDFTTVLVLVMLALPFLLFGAHKTLFGKSYYADVTAARYAQRMKNVGALGTRREFADAEIEVAVVTLKTDEKETIQLEFPEESVKANSIYYKPGDRVLKINGLKYPVKYPLDSVERILCPKCGSFMKEGKTRCGYCKTEL